MQLFFLFSYTIFATHKNIFKNLLKLKLMVNKTLFVSVLTFFSVTTFAQNSSKIKDVRTRPDLYFLQDGQQASSLVHP